MKKKPKARKAPKSKFPFLHSQKIIGDLDWIPMTHVKRGETIKTPHGYSITKL